MATQTKTQIAIDYLVLCGVNQGDAYRAGKDAEEAVRITLEEDKRFKAHQLRPPYGARPNARIRAAAVAEIARQWRSGAEVPEGCQDAPE